MAYGDSNQHRQRGRRFDAWVGGEPKSAFENWLNYFRDKLGRVENDLFDPLAGERRRRLGLDEADRLADHLDALAELGFDLRSRQGLERYLGLSRIEKRRILDAAAANPVDRNSGLKQALNRWRQGLAAARARLAGFRNPFQPPRPIPRPGDPESCLAFMGLDKEADEAAIRMRYHELALVHHPDQGGDEEQMKLLNVAYTTLTKTRRR